MKMDHQEAKNRGIEVVSMNEESARAFVQQFFEIPAEKIQRVDVVGPPVYPSRYKEGALVYSVHLK